MSVRLVRHLAALFLLCLATAATTRNYTLYISSGTLTVNGSGGTSLAAWGY